MEFTLIVFRHALYSFFPCVFPFRFRNLFCFFSEIPFVHGVHCCCACALQTIPFLHDTHVVGLVCNSVHGAYTSIFHAHNTLEVRFVCLCIFQCFDYSRLVVYLSLNVPCFRSCGRVCVYSRIVYDLNLISLDVFHTGIKRPGFNGCVIIGLPDFLKRFKHFILAIHVQRKDSVQKHRYIGRNRIIQFEISVFIMEFFIQSKFSEYGI